MPAPLPAVTPVYGLADGGCVGPSVGVGDGAVAVPPVAQAATARVATARSAARRPARAGRGVRTGTRILRGGEIGFGGGGRGRGRVGPCGPGGQPEGYSRHGRGTAPRSGRLQNGPYGVGSAGRVAPPDAGAIPRESSAASASFAGARRA